MIFNDDYKNVLNRFDLEDSKFVLVTDPPFNIGYKYSTYKDKMKENEYLDMLKDIFNLFDKQVFILYPETMHK